MSHCARPAALGMSARELPTPQFKVSAATICYSLPGYTCDPAEGPDVMISGLATPQHVEIVLPVGRLTRGHDLLRHACALGLIIKELISLRVVPIGIRKKPVYVTFIFKILTNPCFTARSRGPLIKVLHVRGYSCM